MILIIIKYNIIINFVKMIAILISILNRKPSLSQLKIISNKTKCI